MSHIATIYLCTQMHSAESKVNSVQSLQTPRKDDSDKISNMSRAKEDWERHWNRSDDEDPPWQFPDPHDLLLKFHDKIFGSVQSIDKTVLVPLCGKCVELTWFSQKGYHVIGVELSEKGVRKFFRDNELSYVSKDGNHFKIFQNLQNKIDLYCGDFFDLTKSMFSKSFDVIWDRNAFVAINKEDRKRYIQLLSQLTNPDATIFLTVFNYDAEKYQGPPHPFTVQEISADFEEYFYVEESETTDVMDALSDKKFASSLDWINEHFIVLKRKS